MFVCWSQCHSVCVTPASVCGSVLPLAHQDWPLAMCPFEGLHCVTIASVADYCSHWKPQHQLPSARATFTSDGGAAQRCRCGATILIKLSLTFALCTATNHCSHFNDDIASDDDMQVMLDSTSEDMCISILQSVMQQGACNTKLSKNLKHWKLCNYYWASICLCMFRYVNVFSWINLISSSKLSRVHLWLGTRKVTPLVFKNCLFVKVFNS